MLNEVSDIILRARRKDEVVGVRGGLRVVGYSVSFIGNKGYEEGEEMFGDF